MTVLFSNNEQTTLASALTASATSCTVTSGSGTGFPHPVNAGDYFVATLADQATQTIREIVHVTSVNGDTMTIVRGQENTPARAWAVGDVFGNWLTAGQMAVFLQTAAGPAGGDLTGSYPNPQIAPGAVTGPKIAGGAVGPAQLAAGAVTPPALAAGAVTPPAIATGAVGTVAIASGAVTNVKLAGGPAQTVKAAITAGQEIDLTFAQLFSYLGFGPVLSGNPGYITLPGSPRQLVIQWGNAIISGSGASHAVGEVMFPIIFPSGCFGAVAVAMINDSGNPNSTGNNITAIVYNRDNPASPIQTNYGFTVRLDSNQGNTLSGNFNIFWIAIGN